jgi:Uma2 family endonuclease
MARRMEQAVPQFSGRMSEQEYLRFEEAAKTKHEYRHGRIFDMAGGTADHAAIAMNTGAAITNRLGDKPCRVYGSDLRVRINESGHYCYPDLTIACGPLDFAWPDRRTTIVNPQLVIEVTSSSTEAYDRGDKFNDYRRLPSLTEYVLVSQERRQVETFHRQDDGTWVIGPTFTQPDQVVALRVLGIELPLREIYRGIEFPPQEDQPAETSAPAL